MREELDDLKGRISEVFDNYEDPTADEGWMLLRERFPEQAKHRGTAWLWWASAAAVILLFAWLVLRALAVGRKAVALERPFSALVAQGIGMWIGVQALINMGVNLGLLPTKGLTLPLMSFGGTGILVNCMALAVLLRVDWENREMMGGAMKSPITGRRRNLWRAPS